VTTLVEFEVLGLAAPQGSKVLTKWGVMREANKNTMPWRQQVAGCAKQAMGDRAPTLMCVTLLVTFFFTRPRGHYRTGKNARLLRRGAGLYKPSKPDLSKLVRAIEDAMTGIVYRDDAQITSLHATKLYSSEARTSITIEESELPP